LVFYLAVIIKYKRLFGNGMLLESNSDQQVISNIPASKKTKGDIK